MILSAIIAAVLAVFQFVLDIALFRSIFASKAVKAIGLLLLKLALYGGAFALLFALFRAFVTAAAVGFGVGFFPAVLLYGLLVLRKNNH